MMRKQMYLSGTLRIDKKMSLAAEAKNLRLHFPLYWILMVNKVRAQAVWSPFLQPLHYRYGLDHYAPLLLGFHLFLLNATNDKIMFTINGKLCPGKYFIIADIVMPNILTYSRSLRISPNAQDLRNSLYNITNNL